ncbi:MAG TPA: hypothetical protein VEA69_12525 [Tepidisphaeraceae bacterium]|nr:hypothetical protein [Tepidisphaeraceae bacterium]
MNRPDRRPISEVFDERVPIVDAIKAGVADALRRHKLLGESIAVWRDGQVVRVPPEEIPSCPRGAADQRADDGTNG